MDAEPDHGKGVTASGFVPPGPAGSGTFAVPSRAARWRPRRGSTLHALRRNNGAALRCAGPRVGAARPAVTGRHRRRTPWRRGGRARRPGRTAGAPRRPPGVARVGFGGTAGLAGHRARRTGEDAHAVTDDDWRARKKAATKHAIQEHALRLFVEKGYEATTVEEIAAAAGVSHMTFFRYFPRKEEVVEYDEYDPLLEQLLAARPADEPPLTALHIALRTGLGQIL